MAKVKPKSKRQNKPTLSPFKDYWGKSNYIIFGAGIGILILGFILMAQGPWDNPVSLSVSPIILLFAYLIVFPLSLLYKKKKSNSDVSGKN